MAKITNTDKAKNLMETIWEYRDQERLAVSRAQVYALLAISDALTSKDNND